MHECLLFAAVPSAQHDHILRILAGISAMQPLPMQDCHLVFKPTRPLSTLPVTIPGRPAATPSAKPGSTNSFAGPNASQLSNDLFYLQLVGDLTQSRTSLSSESTTEITDTAQNDGEMEIDSADQPADKPTSEAAQTSSETKLWSSHPWTLNFAAVPDVPGKRTATSRLISTIPLLDGNPREFLHGLGYAFVTGYLVHGHRLTHNHLRITLCRTFPLVDSSVQVVQNSDKPMTSGEIPVSRILSLERDTENGLDLGDLKPLDASGGYVLQVSVRVSDGSKPELMNKAFAELAAFRDLLRGVVALQPVERLGLDTRVRSERVVQRPTTQAQNRSSAVIR